MSENIVNVENEQTESPIYSSKFLLNKDLYYDFCSVSYNRTKKIFFIFLCMVTYLNVINLIIGNYDTVMWFGPFMSFMMSLIYFSTKRAMKVGYERMVLSEGKETTLNYELLKDKIISHNDELKRQFYYNQITKFFETKHFILLHLQHNLHVSIEKNNLTASVDEVKAFLMNRCTLVKKKKFIHCANDKKWSLVFLILLIVVSLVGTIVAFVLN